VETIVQPASPDAVQQDLRARINAEKIDAYLWIPRDPKQSFELHMRNPDNFSLIGPLSGAVDQAVISRRLSERGVHLDDIKTILHGADLKLMKVSETGEAEEKGQSIGIAIALVILLYTALLMYGIITMRSVLEEKTTRTMEVLISAVRPFELLAGKILGVALAAFTQFAIWMISTALLSPTARWQRWAWARDRQCPEFTSPFRSCSMPESFSSADIFCTPRCSPRSGPRVPTNRTPNSYSGSPWPRSFFAWSSTAWCSTIPPPPRR